MTGRTDWGSVFALAIDYAGTRHKPLGEDAATTILAALKECGYQGVPVDPTLPKADPYTIVTAVEQWTDDARARDSTDKLVLFVKGHGAVEGGRHFLLAAASPKSGLSNTKALSGADLVDRLVASDVSEAVLIVDACHAGAALPAVSEAVSRQLLTTRGKRVDVAALVSALPYEKAHDGVFVRELVDALKTGSRDRQHWTDSEPFITLFELREELRARIAIDQSAETAGHDGLQIPNPRYHPIPDHPAEIGDLLSSLSVADRNHFLDKASGADAADVGWFFTGRVAASQQITAWLSGDAAGLVVVTGRPGAGKSALLGRMAVLADRDSRRACAELGMLDDAAEGTVPQLGAFDAVVHAKNLGADQVAASIAEQLGIELMAGTHPGVALLGELAEREQVVSVLVDALDEAADGEEALIARDLLRVIGDQPGCRVLVGTRRDTDGSGGPRPDVQGPLISSLEPRSAPFHVIDLSDQETTEDDIALYVERRLAANPAWPSEDARKRAGRGVASLSDGVFLYARFGVKVLDTRQEALVDDPGWERALPADVGAAGMHTVFAEDLGRFDDPVLITEVLRPLAYARGKGLPRREVWAALATELADSGRAYKSTDIARVIREAGWYLVEATEHDQAVFRLFHQAVADHLRHGDDAEIEMRIVECLLGLATSAGWDHANPYIVQSLADHAAAAGQLRRLTEDVKFLTHAPPQRLANLLGLGFDYPADGLAQIFLRTASRMVGATAAERSAILAAEASVQAGAPPAPRPPESPWWPSWANMRPTPFSRRLDGHSGWVSALAAGRVDGRDVIVSGSADRTIRIWDTTTGETTHVLEGHTGPVTAVAVWDLGWGAVIVSGSWDTTIRIWDPTTGQPTHVLEGHTGPVNALAVIRRRKRNLIVSGSADTTIRIWDPTTGQPTHVLTDSPVWITAVGVLRSGDREVVVSAGLDRRIRIADPEAGRTVRVLDGHRTGVHALVVDRIDDRETLVSGGSDGHVGLCVMDGSEGKKDGAVQLLEGHTDWVKAVAVAHIDSRDLVLSAGDDRTVRIWTPSLPEPTSQPALHVGWVNGLAAGDINGSRLIASAGDDHTVRLWDAASGHAKAEFHGHTGPVTSVAIGQLDGRDLVVSASKDRTVRLWDPATGLSTQVLTGHNDWVNAVTVGQIGDANVVVSASDDRSVRIWDPVTGQSVQTLRGMENIGAMGIAGWLRTLAVGNLPDGTAFVCATDETSLRIWDPDTSEARHVLEHNMSGTNALACGTIDGRDVIAFGGTSGVVQIVDPLSGQVLDTITGHRDWVNAVAVGTLQGQACIVSSSSDGTVRIWDATSQRELRSLPMEGVTSLVSRPEALVAATHRGIFALSL